jgi:thiamine monophosphate kinase
MDIYSKASKFARYIRNLIDNGDIVPVTKSHGYSHMGATITDSILQAGVKYDTVVIPRVKNIRENIS